MSDPKMSEPQYVEDMRAEIARLRAEVEWLRGMTGHTKDCPKAEAVVRAAEQVYRMKERYRWDSHGTSRANCPACRRQWEIHEPLKDALAAYRERA